MESLIFGPTCVTDATEDLGNLSALVTKRRLTSFDVLAVAVRTARVNGGSIFPPTLSNQLVETVAEVLNLTGA